MRTDRVVRLFLILAFLAGGMTMAQTIPEAHVMQAIDKLESRFDLSAEAVAIVVDPGAQKLYLVKNRQVLTAYPVSTGTKGLGNRVGSYQTPVGTHRVRGRFGDGAEPGTIFRGRRSIGRLAKIYTEPVDVPEDDVTTRILRLEGMESGVNRGGNVDSYGRYIYIHGTPEEGLIGKPMSHGCVRMRNGDVVELFDAVPEGTLVEILNRPFRGK